MPAWMHFSRSPSIACAVRAKIGMWGRTFTFSYCRILPVASRPPIIGIWTSMRITSYRCCSTSVTACSPFSASHIVIVLFRMRTATFWLPSLSSARRMVRGLVHPGEAWMVRSPRAGNIPFQRSIGRQGVVMCDLISSSLVGLNDSDTTRPIITKGIVENFSYVRTFSWILGLAWSRLKITSQYQS